MHPSQAVLLLLLAPCFLDAQQVAPATDRAHGRDFSIPVPRGLAPLHEDVQQIWDQGGVVLAAPPAPGAYRTNIVVRGYSVASPGEEHLADSAYCSFVGSSAAQQAGYALRSSRVITVAHGRTCQMDRDREAPLPSRQVITVMARPGQVWHWSLVCSFGTRDSTVVNEATAACDEAVAGWRFDQSQ
jgi:hypothetical protein